MVLVVVLVKGGSCDWWFIELGKYTVGFLKVFVEELRLEDFDVLWGVDLVKVGWEI